jgi:hypothetical protein
MRLSRTSEPVAPTTWIYYKGDSRSLMIHLSANTITALHDRCNKAWHDLVPPSSTNIDPLAQLETNVSDDSFLNTTVAQHLANFRLWHVEDLARVRSAADAEIASAKRGIDKINQQRNDLAEQLDVLLLASLPEVEQNTSTRLHSETPGMMIDRLSILSLKMYHTHEEIERVDAPPGHAERNAQRFSILETQRADLASCLDHLWRMIETGERRFKVYRQLKMYNDPSLNPALYNEQRARN